jgi:septal ring factor EnvC (AmiA/AmiB activator)
MTDDDTDHADDTGGTDHGHSALSADPVLVALQLCAIASKPARTAAAIRKLAKLDRQYADTQAKVATLAAQAEQINASLAQREAAIDERERALDEREIGFENTLTDARGELREQHARLADMDRRIRWRVLNSADLLAGFNEQLQDLPDWPQIKQMVPGLPDDPPAAPSASVVSENVQEDWAGSVFTPGSTLTRTINKAARQ